MKILLVCNAGMSSSLLVEKIKKAADERGVLVSVMATSSKCVDEEIGNWDVCLIGPQISYMADKIKNVLKVPVISVEPRIYALADGNSALDMAIKLYEANMG